MPRSRNIKPAFFKNELLSEAGFEARLLFIGLWTLADRNGVLEKRPKRIKAEIFPYDYELDINRYLTVLEQLEFIHTLTDGKTDWIVINNFGKHQNPHHTEKTSNPLPNELKVKEKSVETVKEPLSNGDNPADSCSLIPDSLIPDSLIPDSAPQAEPELASDYGFDDFWKVFKDSRGKADALKAWKTKKLNKLVDEIIAGAERYVKARGDDKKYWKQASGWLNGRRWEDDLSGIGNTGNSDQEIEDLLNNNFGNVYDGEVIDDKDKLL